MTMEKLDELGNPTPDRQPVDGTVGNTRSVEVFDEKGNNAGLLQGEMEGDSLRVTRAEVEHGAAGDRALAKLQQHVANEDLVNGKVSVQANERDSVRRDVSDQFSPEHRNEAALQAFRELPKNLDKDAAFTREKLKARITSDWIEGSSKAAAEGKEGVGEREKVKLPPLPPELANNYKYIRDGFGVQLRPIGRLEGNQRYRITDGTIVRNKAGELCLRNPEIELVERKNTRRNENVKRAEFVDGKRKTELVEQTDEIKVLQERRQEALSERDKYLAMSKRSPKFDAKQLKQAHAEISKSSWEIGELAAAEATKKWIEANYEGIDKNKDITRVYPPDGVEFSEWGSSNNEFDQVYKVTYREMHNEKEIEKHAYVVVEAKGGSAQRGARGTDAGDRVQQGTQPYFRATRDAMTKSWGDERRGAKSECGYALRKAEEVRYVQAATRDVDGTVLETTVDEYKSVEEPEW